MNTQTESFLAETVADWAEVGKPHPHESAIQHVCGSATYTDDLPELRGTLHAALGLSQRAHANLRSMDLDAVRAAHAEGVLRGQAWDETSLNAACAALEQDYAPLSDMRASSAYRMQTAQNLLRRFWLETRLDAPLAANAVSAFAVRA